MESPFYFLHIKIFLNIYFYVFKLGHNTKMSSKVLQMV